MQTDPPRVFLATDADVLSRLVALKVVAWADPRDIPDRALQTIRSALLDERWGDAVAEWIAATGEVVDAYPDEDVWSETRLDSDTASLEIRVGKIFEDEGQ